eukprot:6062091-Amphidinium_carterae.3
MDSAPWNNRRNKDPQKEGTETEGATEGIVPPWANHGRKKEPSTTAWTKLEGRPSGLVAETERVQKPPPAQTFIPWRPSETRGAQVKREVAEWESYEGAPWQAGEASSAADPRPSTNQRRREGSAVTVRPAASESQPRAVGEGCAEPVSTSAKRKVKEIESDSDDWGQWKCSRARPERPSSVETKPNPVQKVGCQPADAIVAAKWKGAAAPGRVDQSRRERVRLQSRARDDVGQKGEVEKRARHGRKHCGDSDEKQAKGSRAKEVAASDAKGAAAGSRPLPGGHPAVQGNAEAGQLADAKPTGMTATGVLVAIDLYWTPAKMFVVLQRCRKLTISIGRHAACDITIPHDQISLKHLVLRLNTDGDRKGQLSAYDESANGVGIQQADGSFTRIPKATEVEMAQHTIFRIPFKEQHVRGKPIMLKVSVEGDYSEPLMEQPAGEISAQRKMGLMLIGGASASGKSSLAIGLLGKATCLLPISQDSFLRKQAPSWDDPGAVDWEMLEGALKTIFKAIPTWQKLPDSFQISSPWGPQEVIPREHKGMAMPETVTVILEGHLVFARQTIVDAAQTHIWLEIDVESGVQRRKRRSHRKKGQVEEWYRGNCWQQYLEHRTAQLQASNSTLHVDATLSREDIIKAVVERHQFDSMSYPLMSKWKWARERCEPSGSAGTEAKELEQVEVTSGSSSESEDSKGNDSPIFEGDDQKKCAAPLVLLGFVDIHALGVIVVLAGVVERDHSPSWYSNVRALRSGNCQVTHLLHISGASEASSEARHCTNCERCLNLSTGQMPDLVWTVVAACSWTKDQLAGGLCQGSHDFQCGSVDEGRLANVGGGSARVLCSKVGDCASAKSNSTPNDQRDQRVDNGNRLGEAFSTRISLQRDQKEGEGQKVARGGGESSNSWCVVDASLASEQLARKTVPGDGNCLFHAVGRGIRRHQNVLRRELIEYLKELPEDLKPLWQSDLSPEQEATRLSDKHAWGGAEDVWTLAQ